MQTCGWGRNVFMGYLNKETDTKESFTDDHWVKLTHLGYVDHNRYLTVLGQPDSFITLNTGDVISPQKVSVQRKR